MEEHLRRRSYILFVARGEDGQLRKIPIPVQICTFIAGASYRSLLSLTGIASSFTRMLVKVSHFNELRNEKEELRPAIPSLSRSPKSAISRWLRWVARRAFFAVIA